jgi:hypothetical protein
MNASVLISSCDAYSDCWSPLFRSLQQQWPGCPYPVALVCNEGNAASGPGNGSIISPHYIRVGPDRGWGPNLALALASVETNYVIYLQEDYFLDSPVSSEAMEQHLEYCIQHGVDYLRLGWPWQDNREVKSVYLAGDDPDNAGSLPEGARETVRYCDDAFRFRYALCLQPAIWRRSVLLQLSAMVHNGWEFERTITQKIHAHQLRVCARVIHSSEYPAKGLKVVDGTAIRKGLWTRAGARYLNENGFEALLAGRETEGRVTDWLMHRERRWEKLPAVVLLRMMKALKINW